MDRVTAHRDYVTQVIRLMIWHVWDLANRPDPVPVSVSLDKNVGIMGQTSLFDGRNPANGLDPPIPEWEDLKSLLASQIESHRGDTGPLEAACWTILAPYIIPTLRVPDNRNRPYGCWEYDLPDDDPNCIDLHFRNAYRPESPFRDHWVGSALSL